MARSLIDLFKGSEFDNAQAPDTETFLEQETTGIRVRSAVELNNPILYGNEALRIGTRTTPSLDLMRDSNGGDAGTGGLIGKGLSVLSGGKIESLPELRNTINSTLGIPQPPIPTRVANDMVSRDLTAQEAIDSTTGTEFGKFLKQTGGGTPQNILRQGVGNAIELAKDKARKFLFGTPLEPAIPDADSISQGPSFKGDRTRSTYTEYNERLDYKGSKSPGDLQGDYTLKQVNLADYSPVYGVERGSKKVGNDNDYARKEVDQKYSPTDGGGYSDSVEGKTLADRGLGGFGINRDEINLTKFGADTTENLEKLDLIPFWIGRYGQEQKIHFRAILSGINENVSPNWSSNNFFGNPYSFYTYGGVERSVTFNFMIYCMSEIELNNNWQKVNELTKLTYPMIEATNLVTPPIVEFRIGDMYKSKAAYIETLTYTFPDNGTWEIDPEVGLLPKFIDVSIGFKFIEQPGSEKELYSIEPSSAAKEARAEGVNFGLTPVGDSNINAPTINIRRAPKDLTGKENVLPTGRPPGVDTTTKYQEKIEADTRRRTQDALDNIPTNIFNNG